MPDPISSSSSSSSSSTGFDPTLDEAGQVCRSDAPNTSSPQPLASVQPEPAVAKLVSSLPKPPAALPPAASPTPSTANNNAQRTSELNGIQLYAAVGKTAAGDAAFAGAALLKGTDPKSGLEVEVLGASAQVGLQSEAQAALLRVGRSNDFGSVNIETVTARANIGIHNDDGSVGFNIGALATIIGGETTYGSGANSVTVGVADGFGAGGHIGIRDKDGDGKHEICAKVTYGPLTFGGCIETPL